MRSGICVKCRSNRIYVVSASTPSGNSIPDLYLGAFSRAQDSHFLACRDCGYTERYINPERLHRLETYGRSLAEAQAIASRNQAG